MKLALFPFMQRREPAMRAVTGAVGIATCIFASGSMGSVGSATLVSADMARM